MFLKQSTLKVQRLILRCIELEAKGFYAFMVSTILFTIIHVTAFLSERSLPMAVNIAATVFISISYLRGAFYNVLITRKTFHDFLTGLHNREFFFRQLRLLEEEQRGFHLVSIDLNKFKGINDLLGHHVGDALLVEVADRLKSSVRRQDVVARLGGDEFGILISYLLNDDDLVDVIKQISASSVPIFVYEGKEIEIKYSIGVATFLKDARTIEDLSRKADSAMYISKKQNLDYYIFNPATYTDPEAEAQLVADLKQALNSDEITVMYQPKFSISENKVIGCESLARWNHPKHGAISPTRFVGIAEEHGLINQLLKNILRRVFRDMQTLSENGFDLSVGINVSADNLCNTEIITEIMTGAKEHGLDLNKIILEVTETAIMKDPEEAIRYLVMLNSVGVRLSLDDFGTGNSSFVYLKHLPISEIKIDRTFTQDMMKTGNDLVIIASTIHLAHSCGISVVTEGVETIEQFEKMRDEGCDVVQGYLISRPLPYNDFIQFMNRGSE